MSEVNYMTNAPGGFTVHTRGGLLMIRPLKQLSTLFGRPFVFTVIGDVTSSQTDIVNQLMEFDPKYMTPGKAEYMVEQIWPWLQQLSETRQVASELNEVNNNV